MNDIVKEIQHRDAFFRDMRHAGGKQNSAEHGTTATENRRTQSCQEGIFLAADCHQTGRNGRIGATGKEDNRRENDDPGISCCKTLISSRRARFDKLVRCRPACTDTDEENKNNDGNDQNSQRVAQFHDQISTL